MVEDFSYAYRSLVSVQVKRGNVSDFVAVASEALDWVSTSSQKPPGVVEEVCVLIGEKAASLELRDPGLTKVLSRCREQLLSAPQSLSKFDEKLKDRKLTAAQ